MNKSKFLIIKLGLNQAQYDLDRQNTKISALSTGELDKYEYLTGEDLGYKPDVVQKAKFEYSPLGQVFNKGLKTDEKQVGLLKRLKNIEDKTDNQLKENKDSQLGIKSIGYTVRQELSQEAKNMLEKLNNQEKLINHWKLNFTGGNKVNYDFTNFSSLRELFRTIYYGEILIPAAEREQGNFDNRFELLKDYKPRKDSKYYKLKDDLLINAKKIYDGRKMIIEAFKNKIFPLSNPDNYPEYTSEKDTLSRSSISSDSEDMSPRSATDKSNFTADDIDKMNIDNADDLDKLLLNTEKYLDPDLIKNHFFNRSLKKISELLKHKQD